MIASMMTIVLLPGMDGTGTLYAPLHAALNGECKLLMLTYPVDQALSYAELEALVQTQLPQDEDYILLGESFSGPIAISIAATQPVRLKALILCATFASNPRPLLAASRYALPYLPTRLAPLSVFSHLLLGRFSSKELRRQLAYALAQVKPSSLKARLRAVLCCDVKEKLKLLKVPVIYLQASRDKLVPASAHADISRQLHDMETYRYDAPHFLLQTKADEVAKDILKFISRIEAHEEKQL
ncbi:pimeloyl-ACP methyl ester carboxylesterase [Undibacterium pigrum]|uniref:Pimeloyl-ACP methyl ester carboxylesterase n=2 Tax=Undibacterium pigrum TaxID=401470 RepID=A0A318JD25_9BURK|nr:pimeloyl-ACP methyl ester carboxylesterase [Undibacterium pigrum]